MLIPSTEFSGTVSWGTGKYARPRILDQVGRRAEDLGVQVTSLSAFYCSFPASMIVEPTEGGVGRELACGCHPGLL